MLRHEVIAMETTVKTSVTTTFHHSDPVELQHEGGRQTGGRGRGWEEHP